MMESWKPLWRFPLYFIMVSVFASKVRKNYLLTPKSSKFWPVSSPGYGNTKLS
jgi:hypothetical protein